MFKCEEGEVFKKHLDLERHQALLDREIDTFRLFHPQEFLQTTAKIVVDTFGKPIGFIMKEMDSCLPNYFRDSHECSNQPQRPVNVEVWCDTYLFSWNI